MTAASTYSLRGKRVFVAGHRGMVGQAIVRRLRNEECEILTVARDALDLRQHDDVLRWMRAEKPDAVFLAAAKVGGILANDTRPAEFIYDNLAIQGAVIDAAYRTNVEKLLFLGSSCIYPKFASQPISEDSLLSGALEPTNEWYAIAKIAGLKMCQAYKKQYGRDFISAMPTNLYGPGDNYDLASSHVIPALLRKAHMAKVNHEDHVTIWGSGTPRREFLHVDDAADAMVFLMMRYGGFGPINVGMGQDISIREVAEMIFQTVGFEGTIVLDTSKPDGTPRKLLDISRIRELGWAPKIGLQEGLKNAYAALLATMQDGTARLSHAAQ